MNIDASIVKDVRGLICLFIFLCVAFVSMRSSYAENADAKDVQCSSNTLVSRIDWGVREAYGLFTDAPANDPKTGAADRLRFTLLREPLADIACMREAIVDRGYVNEFLMLFDDVLEWVHAVNAKTGAEVYSLSHDFENEPGRSKLRARIAWQLKTIAAQKLHRPALRERAAHYFRVRDNPLAGCRAATALEDLAKLGDRDAALELATRYMNGTGLRKNDENALFWFGYAVKLDQDTEMDDRALPLFERLSNEEKHRVALMILSDTFPLCTIQDGLP